MAQLGRSFSALPDDLVNFHWDPVTCAVAAGWSGATIEDFRLSIKMDADVMQFREGPQGWPMRAVLDVDADEFRERWIRCIEAAESRN